MVCPIAGLSTRHTRQKAWEGRTSDELLLLLDDVGTEGLMPVKVLCCGGCQWVLEKIFKQGVELCHLLLQLVQVAQQSQHLLL